MSAFGPKRTSVVAPHMSAFGVKRTWPRWASELGLLGRRWRIRGPRPALWAGVVCNWARGSENRMIAGPQQQPHGEDRSKGERRRDENALDEALKNTFPASDPVSVEQPVST